MVWVHRDFMALPGKMVAYPAEGEFGHPAPAISHLTPTQRQVKGLVDQLV